MADKATLIPCAVPPGDVRVRSQSVRLFPPVPRKTKPKVLHPTLTIAGGDTPHGAAAGLLVPGAHSGVEQCGLRGDLYPSSQSVYRKQERPLLVMVKDTPEFDRGATCSTTCFTTQEVY